MTSVELKESIEQTQLQIQHTLVKRKLAILESLGDYWPTRYGSPWLSGGIPLTNADIHQDRTKTIRNLAQLNLAQNKSQDLCETNGNAAGIIKALLHYVIGSGSTYHLVSNDDDVEPPPVITKKVKKLLKQFCKVNKWKDIEKDMERRLHMHGEFFLRLFPDEDAITKIRFIEPQQIIPPEGENSEGDWSWGIRTIGNDTYTPIEYNIRDYMNHTDEIVEAIFIIHVKINCTTNAKRGIPSFYSVDDELRGTSKVRWASREGEAVRRCVAYFRQWDPAVGKSTIETMANSLATDFITPAQTPQPQDMIQYGGQVADVIRVQKLDGPSVIDTSAEIVDPPAVSFEGAEIVVDQSLQAVAASFQIPEWVVSGKTDVSSYAASLTTESPFTKTIEADQDVLDEASVEVFTRVVEIGVEQEVLPPSAMEEVDITVEFPSSVVRDPEGETNRRKILAESKVISLDTWRSEEGYDSEHEKAKILEEPMISTTPALPGSPSPTPAASYARAT